jgi:hypothetical protein
MIQSKQYLPPHPIVFVMDFSNDTVEIPDYDPEAVTFSNDMCVSVRTIADVDGEVTVFLGSDLPLDAQNIARLVFAGSIRVPSGSLAVVTSENERLLECAVGDETAELRIFVDDEEHPVKVWVLFKQLGA